MIWKSINKPWFRKRPSQLLKRMFRSVSGTPKQVLVNLPWGTRLLVRPSETIGRAIWTAGIYDLAVSEIIYRLTPIDGLVLDVGANIGYMTNLFAFRIGTQGEVFSFEPHPLVFADLKSNVEMIGKPNVFISSTALSEKRGTANLIPPVDFGHNHGLSRIGADDEKGIEVQTDSLDNLFRGRQIHVMKIDVEGHEIAVFRGAEELLKTRSIRHIIFEEHRGVESECCRLLLSHGYSIFQIGWENSGPKLATLDSPPIHHSYEAPSFLATVVPEETLNICRRKGWDLYSRS